MLFPFAIVTINAKTPRNTPNGPLSRRAASIGLKDFWKRVDFTNKLINSTVISVSVAIIRIGLALLNAFALGSGACGGVWF